MRLERTLLVIREFPIVLDYLFPCLCKGGMEVLHLLREELLQPFILDYVSVYEVYC